MLTSSTSQALQALGIQASHSSDFISGLKLMQLVCQVFYEGEEAPLAGKLRLSEETKTGLNVLNINIILNHIKKDPIITLPENIRNLTAFRIIEEEEAMIELVEWILSKANPAPSRNQEDMSPPRQQENQFDNLYFVASLDKQQRNLNDSLDEESPEVKVVRKGSFKVIRPRVSSRQSENDRSRNDSCDSEQRDNIVKKEPLKEILQIDQNILDSDDRDDLQCRKTIPKMYERPPLCRPKLKQSSLNDLKKDPTPEVTTRIEREDIIRNIKAVDQDEITKSLKTVDRDEITRNTKTIDRDEITRNINDLSRQIMEEQRSITMIPDESRVEKKTRKSSRKIFKIDIEDTEDAKKKTLVEWLISIHLLNCNSAKYVNQLHNICKDGVLFVQIMNYYRGRGKQVCFFKEPKRTSELNSNYQKLFTFLAEQVQFKSQLLHQYEFFIPEAQPKAFWSLLSSMHQSFNRRVHPPKPNNVHRSDNSISQKKERQSSRKKANNSTSYSQIKFHSGSLKKDNKNSNSTSIKKEIDTPNRATDLSQKSIAPYGLVQNQEPVEEANNSRTERGGYKQMYLCKFKNMETPQKNRSFHNSSLTKSRLKMSTMGSSKKKDPFRPTIPSISLEIQMRVLQFLQKMEIYEEQQELFRDPYRNGVLICLVVQKCLNIECKVRQFPKSIEDCRLNFATAIETIKSYKPNFNCNYEYLVEDLVKGERALLYGLIWQTIKEDQKECRVFDSSLDNIRGLPEDNLITWIRTVEMNDPELAVYRIRTEEALFEAIISTDFLFRYSWFITAKKAVTPTYERPLNSVQKQSNLKKVIGYFVQNKILRSDYLWKSKNLLKTDSPLLREMLNDLVLHFNHLHKKEQTKSVNFVRYIKREDSESREKVCQKLETTVNQTLNHNYQPMPLQKPKLEVNWMRKLGFTGELQLNNGVLLGKLISKLTMKTINGLHQRPQSKAECLGNIRKAIKLIPKFKWNQYDIYDADYNLNSELYGFLKEKYKHAYAMKGI